MVARMKAAVKIRAVSAYLTQFDAPEPANDPHEAPADLAPADETPAASPEPLVPVEVSGAQAETGAVSDEAADSRSAEINAEIEKKVVAALEEERRACESRLLLARDEWTSEAADIFARKIDAAFTTLRDDIARVLTPFVSQEVFSRTFDQLLASIKKGLNDDAEPVIEIYAAADLVEKLKRSLSDRNIAIIAHESDQTDVRVKMGVTTIETSLEEWLRRLIDSGKGSS